MMDVQTNEIVDIQLVQVFEIIRTNIMYYAYAQVVLSIVS